MIKRIAIIFIVAVFTALSAGAVVAPKTPYPYTQPDGTVIMLVNHGDEFDHWVTCNGVEVERDAEGYYRPVSNAATLRKARRAAAKSLRAEVDRMRVQARSERISIGTKRFLVLLIDFPDRKFTTENAQAKFTRMLNEPGYSDDGGTGSVKDYFVDNSDGQFVPTFDVFGPVTVPESYAYYGQDIGSDRSGHATQALKEACELLDSQINFSEYDNDGDGNVDNTFFFFAGHSQAEGGDADSIWPHQSNMRTYNLVLDGVRILRYGCAAEYKGSSGTKYAGIGTFCHEFSHSLGLIDLYDRDGDTNGQAQTPSYFSLMASGNYLNEGRTPPNMTSLERQELGWMGDFRQFPAAGNYTLGPLSDNTVPYITPADVADEYFLYEMRGGTGWDAYLPKGLVVYHIDKSVNEVAPGVTAAQAWGSHYMNIYGDHPCFYPVASTGYSSLDGQVYPGPYNVTTFIPVPWSGNNLTEYISNIAISGSNAELTVARSASGRSVFGTVKDTDGNPLIGAQVTIAAVEVQASSAKLRSNHLKPRTTAHEATTDSEGNYTLILPESETATNFTVSAACEDYITRAYDISFDRLYHQDFVLRSVGASPRADLKKFPDTGSAYGRGYSQKPQNIMGAVHFSISDLRTYVGMTISTVSFQYAEAEPYSTEEAYVVIDIGGERVLTQKVDDPQPYKFLNVDVSAAGIRIPAGHDIFIGYALKGVNANYPVLRRAVTGLEDASYISSFSLSKSSWSGETGQAILVSASLFDEDASDFINLAAMGFNSIANPGLKTGYSAGDTFTFKLKESISDTPSSITWYFDGARQNATSVVLTAGSHTVEARLTYPDGGTEVLTLEITVN